MRAHAMPQPVGSMESRAPRTLVAWAIAADILVLVPVLIVVFTAVSAGSSGIRDAFNATTLGLFGHSVEVTFLVVPVAGIIGVGMAWLVERTTIPLRRLWLLLNVAPVTLPLFVTSYAWGSFGGIFDGYWGAGAAIAFTFYPIVFLLTVSAMRSLDPALEDAARSMGCRSWSLFWRIVYPHIKGAILGGMLIVCLASLIEYDAFVGVHFQTISTSITALYSDSFSGGAASAVSCLTIALCIAVLVGEHLLQGNASYGRASSAVARGQTRSPLSRRGKVLAFIAAAVVALLAIGVPVGMVMSWFVDASAPALGNTAGGTADLIPATTTTVWTGVLAGVLGLLLAFPIGYMVSRRRRGGAVILERASFLAFALPDVVCAAALGYLAGRVGTHGSLDLPLFIFATAILYVPVGVIALAATLSQIDARLDDVARSLGCGRWGCIRRITVPIARPGIAAAFVLLFSLIVGADPQTAQTLLPAGLNTLGTDFWSYSGTVAFTLAAPSAAAMFVLSLLCTLLLTTRFGTVRK